MKNEVLKICLLCAVFAVFANNLSAQYATALTITDIEQSVARKMEANASALLTEINRAFFDKSNRPPQLTKISGLSARSISAILSMWEMTSFRCIETEVIERGYQTPTGYQVRNIPLFLKSMPEDEQYRETFMIFDKSGNIVDMSFVLSIHEYEAIMNSEGNEVTDLRRRQLLLNFVENFRTAYNRKDIKWLEKVFSDDALIITGKVISQVKSSSTENVFRANGIAEEKIEYQVKTKEEYIKALRSVFKNNAKINVVFDNIEVVQHPKYDDIYGIKLKQGWYTTNYSDVGILFLMIDFKDGLNMQVHVRVWQPEKYSDGTLLPDEEIQKMLNERANQLY